MHDVTLARPGARRHPRCAASARARSRCGLDARGRRASRAARSWRHQVRPGQPRSTAGTAGWRHARRLLRHHQGHCRVPPDAQRWRTRPSASCSGCESCSMTPASTTSRSPGARRASSPSPPRPSSAGKECCSPQPAGRHHGPDRVPVITFVPDDVTAVAKLLAEELRGHRRPRHGQETRGPAASATRAGRRVRRREPDDPRRHRLRAPAKCLGADRTVLPARRPSSSTTSATRARCPESTTTTSTRALHSRRRTARLADQLSQRSATGCSRQLPNGPRTRTSPAVRAASTRRTLRSSSRASTPTPAGRGRPLHVGVGAAARASASPSWSSSPTHRPRRRRRPQRADGLPRSRPAVPRLDDAARDVRRGATSSCPATGRPAPPCGPAARLRQ